MEVGGPLNFYSAHNLILSKTTNCMNLFPLLTIQKILLLLWKQSDADSNLNCYFVIVVFHCNYLNRVQQNFKFSQ